MPTDLTWMTALALIASGFLIWLGAQAATTVFSVASKRAASLFEVIVIVIIIVIIIVVIVL